jgi:hydrogenase maturation protease
MSQARVLIAGIGNIFLDDDAFGVEVAQRLVRHELPEVVRVVDFGIRGLDLAYALLDEYEAVILIDAVARGGRPGTLYVIQPEQEDQLEPQGQSLSIRTGWTRLKVLRLARALGAPARPLLVVGCEPAPTGEKDEMKMELSEPVRAAVDEAVALVASLATRLLDGEWIEGSGDDRTPGKEVRTCRD